MVSVTLPTDDRKTAEAIPSRPPLRRRQKIAEVDVQDPSRIRVHAATRGDFRVLTSLFAVVAHQA